MINDLTIRTAATADVDKIHTIYAGEEGPWADRSTCFSWVTRRLGRDFYIQLAELGGKPVGHGEWIVSDEPAGKTFFLGQIQVAKAYQRLGIGRTMLADGEREARRRGCVSVTTIPEPDTDARYFYERCGYRISRRFMSAEADVAANVTPEPINIIDEIPEDAISKKRFVLGMSQSAARHMWEVISRRPDCDHRIVKCAEFPDGSYAAVFWFNNEDTVYALAFGNISPDVALGHCFSCADAFGIKRLNLVFDVCSKMLFNRFDLENAAHSHFEMLKLL